MNGKGRIGLFGGSFDPIHTGHLILAQTAMDYALLDRIYFIPTALPPHKDPGQMTPFELRRRMVELAIADNDRFELSLFENRDSTCFTYETVRHFRDMGYGREELHLILGIDSLSEIAGWKNPGEIFRNATIVTMERPDHKRPELVPRDAAVIMISSGSNSISSSLARRLIREGRSVRYIVPGPVERFISENSLYRSGG